MSLRFTKVIGLTTRFGTTARVPPHAFRSVYNNIDTEGFDTSLRDDAKETKMDPRKDDLAEYSKQVNVRNRNEIKLTFCRRN